MIEWLVNSLLLTGTVFMLLAGVGVLRLNGILRSTEVGSAGKDSLFSGAQAGERTSS